MATQAENHATQAAVTRRLMANWHDAALTMRISEDAKLTATIETEDATFGGCVEDGSTKIKVEIDGPLCKLSMVLDLK